LMSIVDILTFKKTISNLLSWVHGNSRLSFRPTATDQLEVDTVKSRYTWSSGLEDDKVMWIMHLCRMVMDAVIDGWFQNIKITLINMSIRTPIADSAYPFVVWTETPLAIDSSEIRL
jgi:hypothetical protein